MDVQQLIRQSREALEGKRVYAEPYERDGVTVTLGWQLVSLVAVVAGARLLKARR